MIDEYLRKIENIISPQTYDLNNYKDKILKSELEFPDRNFIQGNESENELKSEVRSEVRSEIRSDVKSQARKTSKTLTQTEKSFVENTSRSKVHNLNVKNMAYRQQIDALNRKIEEQGRIIDSQRRTIEENKVSIENNCKYLLKLESYLVEAGKNKTREKFTLNLIGVNTNFANECKDQASKASFTVERNEMRELIVNLINENQKLKQFQSKVISLSQTYDEINNSMMESLREATEQLHTFYNNNQEVDSDTVFYLNEINQNIQKVFFCVEETINAKQLEYNQILEAKDSEMEFLRKEIVILNSIIEQGKKDRMKDQKTMIEIECQNSFLREEIDELNKTINENYMKLKLLDTENISSKINVRVLFVEKNRAM